MKIDSKMMLIQKTFEEWIKKKGKGKGRKGKGKGKGKVRGNVLE